MSEENKKTDEETQVDLEVKRSEVRKNEAEARKVEAEASKAEAEAREAEIKAYDAELSFRKRQSDDERNHLYRFDGEVSTSSVKKCMTKLTEWSRLNQGCSMEIVFSSPGGSIIDGFELFDFIQELRSKGHKITTGSLGMAASMAGVLLQAGDHRWVGHQSWIMIHRAAFGAYGKTFEVEDEVKFVRRIEERILDLFETRSKLTKRKIKRNWDRKDWWISADEALDLKLVDEIRGMMPEYKKRSKKK